MIVALWMIWFLLFFERRRRLAHLDLIREQKERIDAQASRSTLAEITSSLGHEINQPVAAIESLADTAGILVESGDRLEAGRTSAGSSRRRSGSGKSSRPSGGSPRQRG